MILVHSSTGFIKVFTDCVPYALMTAITEYPEKDVMSVTFDGVTFDVTTDDVISSVNKYDRGECCASHLLDAILRDMVNHNDSL